MTSLSEQLADAFYASNSLSEDLMAMRAILAQTASPPPDGDRLLLLYALGSYITMSRALLHAKKAEELGRRGHDQALEEMFQWLADERQSAKQELDQLPDT